MTPGQKAEDTIVGKIRGASPTRPINDQLDIQNRFTIPIMYALVVIKDTVTKAAHAAAVKKKTEVLNEIFCIHNNLRT